VSGADTLSLFLILSPGMPTFDQSDKEKLNALIQEARKLREESRRLQAKAEALRNFIEQNEQNKTKQADRPKNKK